MAANDDIHTGTHDADDYSTTSSDGRTGRSGTTRRTLLKSVAAAGVGASIFSSRARAGSGNKADRYAARFDNVVDVVDAGADPNGEDSVVDVMEDHRDDHTLLYFPPGRYYIDRRFRFTGFENFGVVGEDATLVPADYYNFGTTDDRNFRMFRLGIDHNPGRDLLFEGFTVDQRAANTGVRVIEGIVEDGLVVRDIEVVGQHDSGEIGPGRFAVTDPAGTGIVDNFRAPDGGEWHYNTPNEGNIWRGPTGMNCTASNHGSMTFKDCVMGAFPSHGLYANSDGGQVIVKNGLYENSNGVQIRLGGEDSYIQGARVVIDQNRPHDVRQYGVRFDESPSIGIWDTDIELSAPNGDAIRAIYPDDLHIQNVRVSVKGNVVNHGINIKGGVGKVVMKYCTIDFDTAGGAAIRAENVDYAGAEPILIDRCIVGGDAGHESNRAGIWSNRDNVEIRTCSVEQTGDSKRRAVGIYGDNCAIDGGEYVGNDHAIGFGGSDGRITDVYAEAQGPSIRLDSDCSRPQISESVIVNGIYEGGAADVETWANRIV